jgi:murein DD-endopeptidase MepM/ murein hydrolase activator NlpD
MFQKIKIFFFIFICFFYLSLFNKSKNSGSLKKENFDVKENGKFEILKYEIKKNDALHYVLLFKINILPSISNEIISCFKKFWDPKKIKEGDLIEIKLDGDYVKEFVYRPKDNPLLKLCIHKDSIGYKGEILNIPYKKEYKLIERKIEGNLFDAFSDLENGDFLAISLSEIFAWEIDFNSEIRKGDSVKFLYEAIVPFEGDREIIGDIIYVKFKGKYFGKKEGFLFKEEDGKFYYTRDGKSIRKGFLKSPLPFTRITSKFSYRRLHPILKIRRPHYGIDYGAPIGTPVRAIGDGIVTFCGWKGSYGNYVRIRHKNGYETGYGHLKKIKVYKGKRVKQGEIVGWVGKTGLATGPHLHFEILKNGIFLNFLKIKFPPDRILTGEKLELFKKNVLEIEKILNYIENKNKIS